MLISCFLARFRGQKHVQACGFRHKACQKNFNKSVRISTPKCNKPNLKDGKGKVMGYMRQNLWIFF